MMSASGIIGPKPTSNSVIAAFRSISMALSFNPGCSFARNKVRCRSEEHTSELQSLMRISYAVFCLTKKNTQQSNVPLTTVSHTRYQHYNTRYSTSTTNDQTPTSSAHDTYKQHKTP